MTAPTLGPQAANCNVSGVYPQVEIKGYENRINIGLFFDGTNNNWVRDKDKYGDSNIVHLYRADRHAPRQHFLRVYS